MAEENSTPAPDQNSAENPATSGAPRPDTNAKAVPNPVPPFQADAFLSGKKGDKARVETAKAMPPQIIKRGGVGFFTAFLMSTVAAGAGAYLALFAGARPDLLQKTGIAAYVPQPPKAPSLGASSDNLEPLVARVSALEAELLTLQTKLVGGVATPDTGVMPGSAAPAPAAPANSANPATAPVSSPLGVTADTVAVTRELAGVSGRVTAIETRLAALDPTGAGGAIIAGLQADIAGLRAIIGTLQQQAAAAPSPVVTFAVISLAEAANRPGPFLTELDSVRAAMPGVPEVTALDGFARTGVATRTLLQERFTALQVAGAAQASAAAPVQKDTGVMAWFKGLFDGMVKVQTAPDGAGSGADAVLTRAKAKLDQGDLAGSADELATIPTPSVLVTDWASAARKRLALESAISAVRGAVGRAPTIPAAVAAPAATSAPAATAPLPPPPVPVTKSEGPTP